MIKIPTVAFYGNRMLFTGIVLVLSFYLANSQNNLPDTAFTRRMIDSTIAFYNKSLGENTLLYNGREYTGNYSRTVGHPFYASDRPQKGSLLYDRILYQHSAISYDLTNDEVVIKTAQNVSVKLLIEKLDRFSLGDHVFVKISQNDGVNTGFYEMLHGGLISVIAKRRKQLIPSSNLEDPYRFVEYDRFFIKTNDSYHEIDNERSLLALFPGNKKEIRKYMRNKGISFKKNPEDAIIGVTEYFAESKRK